MNAVPIYLLRGAEPDGPHEYADVAALLAKKQITPETLSCVEGMPGWRALAETQVWAQAKYLEPVRSEAQAITTRIGRHRFDIRYARHELKQALKRKKILAADLEILDVVLETNGLLERMYLHYVRRGQHWKPEELAKAPALELEPPKKQKFARDWPAAWQQAGGKIYGGRMLARADDPAWSAMSDFGFPFPPFSFDFLAGIRSVTSAEAASLGMTDLVRPVVLPEIAELKFAGL